MAPPLVTCVVIAVALASYPLVWLVLGIEHEPKTLFYERWDMLGVRLEERLRRLDQRFGSRWLLPVGLTCLSFLAYRQWTWTAIDATGTVRGLVVTAAAMVTWKSVTMDIDLASGRAQLGERALMVLAMAGTCLYPGFLFLFLYTGIQALRAWQHHQHVLLRSLFFVLGGLLGVLVCAPFAPRAGATVPLCFLILTVTASHYFVSGVRKLQLGKRWYAWAWHNRLSNLFLSAYLWGWCRFRSEARTIRWAKRLQRISRPAQIFALAFELATLFVLCDRAVADVVFGCAIAFHVLTLVLSGIFFWQSIVFLVALLVGLHQLPSSTAAELFGPIQGLAAAALLLIFPLRKRLWRPTQLGWWDTPWICRVDWIVHGASGRRYGLYNDFMNPNDRIFGNKIFAELGQHPRLSFHCGESEDERVAIAFRQPSPDLAAIKRELGQVVYVPPFVRPHHLYLRAFFTAYNQGKPKRVVPRWLRAPGDQLFYWGALERFRGQEPVARIELVEREQWFDGTQIVTVRRDTIGRLDFT